MFDPERLREIKTFPSLVKYLRDDLEWPIEADDFEDLTFDYEPEELGIDAKTAAKIEGIKQLRPLVTNQPWGVFFVKFEPKRLPVVALRRILSRLVIKKRASARKSDRASWNLDDLLFISNYGEGSERQITFAHFAQDEQMGDLPTLKVLGWDDADTVLHIDHVHHELREKLNWPEKPNDFDGWREKWSSAFILRHREVITTSKDLAVRLADLAKRIRSRANQILAIETEHGPLRKLHKAFQQALIHNLEEDDFADMYAQTVTYGLLAARVSQPAGVVAGNLADMVPITNPFLKEMLSTFLTVGGRKGKMDFDELGVREVVELLNSPDTHMEDILFDFGNRTRQEDPVIHFYELFLTEYDKKKKVERGVFYTPQPVVSYIVRSVHEILQKEFGLEDGLADTKTWGEMAKKFPAIKIPKGLSANEPFVNILDPATGTATFLVEAIDVIHKTMMAKWMKNGLNEKQRLAEWNNYTPKHLLPRLHGFELMMAPYAIAHMKLGLKLLETGYRFGSDERARIYLTNSLDPPQDFADTFALMAPALAYEAKAVNEIKRFKRFTVVIGNPPYAGESANPSELPNGAPTFIGHLLRDYFWVDGQPLRERNSKWLHDDYVKFLRYGEHLISEAGSGILGYITNHSFVFNPTFRGMRQHMLKAFQRLDVLNLHGSTKLRERSPDGTKDENVFDIEPGVAITLGSHNTLKTMDLRYGDLWGTRDHKYATLALAAAVTLANHKHEPAPPFYLFFPQEASLREEYTQGFVLTEIFPLNNTGIITKRDGLTIHYTAEDVWRTVNDFLRCPRDVAYARFNLPEDVRDWSVDRAKDDLRSTGLSKDRICRICYRPFDPRFTYHTGHARGFIGWPVEKVMCHMVSGTNVALCIGRAGQVIDQGEWDIVICSRHMTEFNLFRRGGNVIFPLYLQADQSSPQRKLLSDAPGIPNISSSFLSNLATRLGLKAVKQGGLPSVIVPEDIFCYAYAVFHSPGYRKRYAEFLKIDFPRLPLTSSLELFCALAKHGGELVALHLMESPKLDKPVTKWKGTTPSGEVEKVTYLDDTVWIDKAQAEGFRGVPENVWNFHIGGYQVCEKWLKDRKGRKLSADDITHYQRIVVAFNETIRLMGEIEEVIEKYGGWPGAFTTGQNVQLKKDEVTVPVHPQEEFILSLIKRLRTGKNKGVHSVYSGFNGLFKEKFLGEKPQAWTKKLAEEGRIITTPISGKGKEYQMIYLSENAPKN